MPIKAHPSASTLAIDHVPNFSAHSLGIEVEHLLFIQ